MHVELKEADKVEILTLQDNYVDLAAMDGNEIVQRALPVKDMEIKNSIVAEHGFSAIVTVTSDNKPRSILFDFGFSEHGAEFNVDALGVDLATVETLVLSHGHMDHFGGLEALVKRIGKPGIEMVLHPAAFRKSRYLKVGEELNIKLPTLAREKIEKAGITVTLSEEPKALLDASLLFLGEIPKSTDFEKGFPRAYYAEDGIEKWDPIEEDSAVVVNVSDMGLVVLSGCAHSGIINTVRYAQQVTGVKQVYVIMGGFHLSGTDFEPIITPTTDALKEFNPQYVVPTHCTGRKAVMQIEREMPDKFLLNMSGSKMTFSSKPPAV